MPINKPVDKQPLVLADVVDVLNKALTTVAPNTLVSDVIQALRDAAVSVVDERQKAEDELRRRIYARAQELLDARQPHQLHVITGADCYEAAKMEITGRLSTAAARASRP